MVYVFPVALNHLCYCSPPDSPHVTRHPAHVAASSHTNRMLQCVDKYVLGNKEQATQQQVHRQQTRTNGEHAGNTHLLNTECVTHTHALLLTRLRAVVYAVRVVLEELNEVCCHHQSCYGRAMLPNVLLDHPDPISKGPFQKHWCRVRGTFQLLLAGLDSVAGSCECINVGHKALQVPVLPFDA